MTGLGNKISEENLFQNIRMADKVTKWTPEAMNLKDNIIEDIIKRVSDLKQIAKELEDTKMMLKVNTETKIDKSKEKR